MAETMGSTNTGERAAAVLECRDVAVGHGSVVVARNIDLSVCEGSVLAILGPNGAGKSTLLNTIAGILPRSAGDVLLDGTSLRSGRPAEANRRGVVLVPDDRALFTRLTLRENIQIAHKRGGPNLDDMLDLFPALRDRLKVTAGSLSGGEQQMLAVARALVQEPRALLIDEMSMGLAPIIVEDLLPIVRRIADETRAVVILVEQHVQLALDVADEAIVLVHGAVKLRGRASELAKDPRRIESAYLRSEESA